MSEEEKIIENVKQTIEEYEEVIQEEQEKGNAEDVESGIEIKQAIQGLLDLYTKQKQNIDKLQKENKEYIDIFNSTEKIMNGQERTKDKLLKENVELQKENEDMREELQMYVDTPISKLKEENKVLRGKNKYLQERLEFRVNYCNELEHELYEEGNYIHKEVIRKKIKELEDKDKMFTIELPEDVTIYQYAIEILKELLGE